MRTRIKFLWLSVLLALTALVGLTWVQMGLLRDANALKQQIFESRVRSVLVDVIRDLETMEMASSLPIDTLQWLLHGQQGRINLRAGDDSSNLQVLVLTDSGGTFQQRVVGKSSDSTLQYHFEAEFFSGQDTVDGKAVVNNQSLVYRSALKHPNDSDLVSPFDQEDKLFRRLVHDKNVGIDSSFPVKDVFISQVIHRLRTIVPRPLKERVNKQQLDSLFDRHLKMAMIDLSPVFAVFDSGGRVLFAIADSAEFSRPATITAPLFPFDMGGEAGELRVRFPGQEAYLWRDRWTTILGSGIFMSMLAATVALGLVVIRRQDRVRQRTQEFIANLTHEFTTPVSTIQLAVEALSKDQVVTTNERSTRMVDMIGSENRRMRAQVQKILQLAQLEEGNIQLSRERIDLNELIQSITTSFHLTIEQRQGSLTARLTDDQLLLRGDRTHLGNLISNLIDNAIKYSPSAPVVTVVSKKTGDQAKVSVIDQGIGIDAAEQSTVFEKFVRGSTGNIHDVKGFGIGLSYVKAVAEAHGGTVELTSKPGSGTTITVTFPLAERSLPRE